MAIQNTNHPQNLAAAFFAQAARNPGGIVYKQGEIIPGQDQRAWPARSFSEVKSTVLAISDYLQALGVSRGSHVAILSNTRPEWMEADFAVLAIGAVTVSIYQSLTPPDIGYILFDSQSEIVFAENSEQVEKLRALLAAPCSIPATEDRPAQDAQIKIRKIISFEKVSSDPLVISWSEILEQSQGKELPIPEVVNLLGLDDVATLVYTSGTTGPAKGVIQTHGNHLANVRQVNEGNLVSADSTVFLFLPLAHSFARLMGMLAFTTPTIAIFPTITDRAHSKLDPKSLSIDFREGGAEIIAIVPRLLEKMQAAIMNRAVGRGLAPTLLRITLSVAKRVSLAREEGRSPAIKDRLLFALTAPIRNAIRKKIFGPNFKYAVSGGAKLSVDTARFFLSLNLEVLEGYGLTETCVATNANRSGKVKIGTVGPILAPDIEIKIAPDNEILFKGPNVTKGYHLRPTATQAAWDADGWFHTGDFGSIDEDGYLRIEGRKKELIVTSGGKKIPPDGIEQRLKNSEYIAQAVLIGDDRNYCVALIYPEVEAVRIWATEKGVELQVIHEDQRAKELLLAEVERVNSALASFETIKRIAILPEEMTVENALLTPTFKVKRKEVVKRYAHLIEELYRNED